MIQGRLQKQLEHYEAFKKIDSYLDMRKAVNLKQKIKMRSQCSFSLGNLNGGV